MIRIYLKSIKSIRTLSNNKCDLRNLYSKRISQYIKTSYGLYSYRISLISATNNLMQYKYP